MLQSKQPLVGNVPPSTPASVSVPVGRIKFTAALLVTVMMLVNICAMVSVADVVNAVGLG